MQTLGFLLKYKHACFIHAHTLSTQRATATRYETVLWDSLNGPDRCALSVDKEASGSIRGHYRDVPTGTRKRRCRGWRYIWGLDAVFFASLVGGLLHMSAGTHTHAHSRNLYNAWTHFRKILIYWVKQRTPYTVDVDALVCSHAHQLMASQETCCQFKSAHPRLLLSIFSVSSSTMLLWWKGSLPITFSTISSASFSPFYSNLSLSSPSSCAL